MNWLYYLLEANLYLIIFYGFYRLLLHKETFYTLNRYYLILSTLISFIIPFFQLGFLSKQIVVTDTTFHQQVQQDVSFFRTENMLLFLYAIVAGIFIAKIIWGFRHIAGLLKKPNKRHQNGITIIELANTGAAFSFFNMLFIDPDLPQKTTILKHEMVHIQQKHSFDILFFELIRSLNWFNPVTHYLKTDIKLLHEYLADEETTSKGIEKYEYALFLIQNSYGDQKLKLTNQIFNSSILKRRISMLNQRKSAKWARLRLLMVIPVVGGMLCTSTMAFTKDYGVIDLYPKKESVILIVPQDTTKKKKLQEVRILPVQKTKKNVPPIKPSTVTRVKINGAPKTPPLPPPVAPKPPIVKKVKGVKLPPPPPVEPQPKKVKGLKLKELPPPPPVELPPAKKNNN